MKRDSSEKRTGLHCVRLCWTCSWHHRSRSARWYAMRTLRRTGRLARRSAWRGWVITIWEEIRFNPAIWRAVKVAVLNLSRRSINRMYRYRAGVIALGRPTWFFFWGGAKEGDPDRLGEGRVRHRNDFSPSHLLCTIKSQMGPMVWMGGHCPRPPPPHSYATAAYSWFATSASC